MSAAVPQPRPAVAEPPAAGSGLAVDVLVRRPGFSLEAAFDVEPGSVLAVLGPNGAGKSTLLGLLAGLVTPDRGRIALGGRVLTDVAGRVAVPVHRRGVGLLAQDALLFPHLTAHGNVAFGPAAAGRSRAVARRIADRWLAEVGGTELSAARPRELSGGQAQRVAVARALATDPDLLLLDEPMAALDVDAAPAIRALLRRVLDADGRTTVLVTHDPLDALVLAERVIVLSAGRIVEDGRTRDVLARPRTAFTARIAGLNLIPGRLCAEGIEVGGGLRITGHVGDAPATGTAATGADPAATASGDPRPPDPSGGPAERGPGSGGGTGAGGSFDGRPRRDAAGEPAVAVFAPRAVAVYRERPTGSPRNVLTGVVDGIEPHGDGVRIRAAAAPGGPTWVDGVAADVTHAAVADLRLQPGSPVWFAVKAAEVAVHRVAGG